MEPRIDLNRPPLEIGTKGLRFLRHLPNFVRLYWRLFRDPRVSRLPKALLVVAVAYVVLPFDLLPDFVPLLGQIDDALLLIAASQLFIRLCPAAVVQEHVRRIDAGSS